MHYVYNHSLWHHLASPIGGNWVSTLGTQKWSNTFSFLLYCSLGSCYNFYPFQAAFKSVIRDQNYINYYIPRGDKMIFTAVLISYSLILLEIFKLGNYLPNRCLTYAKVVAPCTRTYVLIISITTHPLLPINLDWETRRYSSNVFLLYPEHK